MNDIIQSILVAISITGAIAWIVIRVVKGASKADEGCKDCPLVDKCAKKHKCADNGSGCGCK